MSAVLGALLLAVTVVLYRWAYIHHRRPVRSLWARNGLLSMLVQFAILSALAAGSSFAIHFVVTFGTQAVTLIEVAAMLVIVVTTALSLRALNRQWRRFQAEAPGPQADASGPQVPANDAGSGLPPAGGQPRRAS